MTPSVPTSYLQYSGNTYTSKKHIRNTQCESPPPWKSFTENGLCSFELEQEETTSRQEWSQKWLHSLQGRNTANRQKYSWTVTALYKQPLYPTAWFSGFWEVVVEWEDSIFSVVTRISASVYVSALAENVSFVPSSALFPFNDSFAVNPICELLK